MNIDHLAAEIPAARRALTHATAKHTDATDKVAAIAARIGDTERRQAGITASRLDGKADRAETEELHALGLDLDALRRMHCEATATAAALLQPQEAARNRLAVAERALAQAEQTATFEAIKERAQELERRYLAAVAEVAKLGKALGHLNFGYSFAPNQELVRMVQHRTAPQA